MSVSYVLEVKTIPLKLPDSCASMVKLGSRRRRKALKVYRKISGRGVTANIPVLGTGDSGFESLRPDKDAEKLDATKKHIEAAD